MKELEINEKNEVRARLKYLREKIGDLYRECGICPFSVSGVDVVFKCKKECYKVFKWYEKLYLHIMSFRTAPCPCYYFKSERVVRRLREWLDK